jgi:serine/threonine-protein kinase RsbW
LCHTIPVGAAKRFSARISAGDDTATVVLAALSVAEGFSRDAALGETTAARLAVVVEELVSNSVRHGAGGRELVVTLVMEAQGDALRIALEDDGVAFDPTAQREFTGPDARTGGGVGIALIRAWARELDYARIGGRNRVTLLLATVA